MLRLRLLGELEVWRGDARLALPPSRKTRALLGYLAASGREHRRDRLCSLFWEVPDDPRGSLRWSLSRLRPIVDEAGATRIAASRESVGFDPAGAEVDLLTLRAAVEGGFDRLETSELEALAGLYRGEFLEGLELPAQHEFQAWCLAEREDLRQHQIRLLGVLADRLSDRPERQLAPLRQLVQIEPYGEAARVAFLRALLAAGREQEAERQFQTAERLFRELGGDAATRLTLQWRALRARSHAAESAEPPEAVPEAAQEMPRVANGEAPIRASLEVPAVRSVSPPPVRSQVTRAPLGRTPFVGRRSERRRLAAAIGAATRLGEAGVTLILGEPGMGKSRLIVEACAIAEQNGMRVFSGRAHDGGLAAAYASWSDALGGLPEIGADAGLASGRELLFAAVTQMIAGDDGSSALVALDDMHWSDEASAALLNHVVRAARDRPLSLVIGARAGELFDNSAMTAVLRGLRAEGLVDEIRLAPLTAAEVAELAATLASGDSVARIVSLSGGNPLFAVELARDLTVHTDALPSSLRELLRERLDRLPPGAAEVLRWGAVLGTSFRADLLRATAGLAPIEFLQALDLMERHGMLRPTSEDTYTFSHDLVRRAVLSTLSAPRRKLMHLRIAEVLAADGRGEEGTALQLATHAAEGGDYGMAARACVSAGRRALRVFAHVEAAAMVRAGRHYAEHLRGAEQIERQVELADIEISAERGPERGHQIARLSDLAERALDAGRPELASRCYTMLAHLRWQSGEWQGAKRDTLQAEFVSRLTGIEERVVAMAEAARCLAMLERDLEQAEALVLEAEALARRVPIEPNAIPDALGLLRAHQGSFAEAGQLFARAREIARRDGDRLNEYLVIEHHVVLTLTNGEVNAELCDELVALARKVRPGSELAFAEALQAVCRLRAGQAEAIEQLAAALERLRTADARHRLVVAGTGAARALLETGHHAEALRLAGEALDNADRLDRASDIAEALAAMVEIESRSATADAAHVERLLRASGAAISASARAASERALGAVGLG